MAEDGGSDDAQVKACEVRAANLKGKKVTPGQATNPGAAEKASNLSNQVRKE